ncbi:hypothetical protein KA012_01365 [Candidatus Woesebacteria bacterium]|nr:hypothetical protein [Candidatus Woesebacteria bacterium]
MSTSRAQLARSRLSSRGGVSKSVNPVERQPRSSKSLSNWFSRRRKRIDTGEKSNNSTGTWLHERLLYIVLTIASSILLLLLLTKVSPSKVADLGLPESYLPLLLLMFTLSFSTVRLFAKARFAVYAALVATLIIFFRIHHLIAPASYLLGLAGFLFILELLVVLAKKR